MICFSPLGWDCDMLVLCFFRLGVPPLEKHLSLSSVTVIPFCRQKVWFYLLKIKTLSFVLMGEQVVGQRLCAKGCNILKRAKHPLPSVERSERKTNLILVKFPASEPHLFIPKLAVKLGLS